MLNAFREWVHRQAYEDGSNALNVVTVEFGEGGPPCAT
jgi:hypothetical protein